MGVGGGKPKKETFTDLLKIVTGGVGPLTQTEVLERSINPFGKDRSTQENRSGGDNFYFVHYQLILGWFWGEGAFISNL